MTQNDLDPTRRSGRYVTDGREPQQPRHIPDSGRRRDFVGIQIHSKSATEFPDSTRVSHKRTVQDFALSVARSTKQRTHTDAIIH